MAPLSMDAVLAASCAGLLVLWRPAARGVRSAGRLADALADHPRPASVRLRASQRMVALAAGLAPVTMLAPSLGIPLGVGAGLAARSMLLRPTAPSAAPSPGLALATDLLAAALSAGVTLPDAFDAAAVGTPTLAETLGRLSAALRLGVDPLDAVGADPPLRRLAQTVARSQAHGVSAAPSLGRLAADLRAEEGAAAAERARRAGVHVVAPLALCFLPAFVLVAIVPVVLGLAHFGG